MDEPTIYDVSRLSGVSTATVSRAFTAPERVKEATRTWVYAAAEELHYRPSAIARAMARQQTDKIAFLICKEGATILDAFYAGICEGVMCRVNGTAYHLLISTAEEWAHTAQRKQIDGVILAGNANASLISEFQRQNVRVVLVNTRAEGFDLPLRHRRRCRWRLPDRRSPACGRAYPHRHAGRTLFPLYHQHAAQCLPCRHAGAGASGGRFKRHDMRPGYPECHRRRAAPAEPAGLTLRSLRVQR